MALVSLAEAARLVGKSKPTLLRARNKGMLSMDRNSYNEWIVDTSELIRVYGSLRETPNETRQQNQTSLHETAYTDRIEAHTEKLERIIETLEKAVEAERETIRDIRKRLDESEQERRDTSKELLLLKHQTVTAPLQAKRPYWAIGLAITAVTAVVIALVYAIKSNTITIN